ncbi:uncharacterized protein DUF4127 [Oceanotoga teriensis]|uniref:Uncharacterized protein DUF4127 n=1 Tax=Oceanotoga teriensis TaxID=515440 RepID=A0AA45HIY0_9BACT|nr:DUF4127 family protein [Oceanotoga teriensis]PWJ95107.1 uncharacterized protein DUF4127 [Oceanotoga teriensis]
MKRILLIPLDSRPVNIDYVYELSKISENTLIYPPKKFLDDFYTPADINGIIEWSKNQKYDIAIISIDMLVYGGLINSRLDKITLENALKNLQKIKIYKKDIYIYSIIRRALISVKNKEDEILYNELKKYFITKDKKYIENLPSKFKEDYKKLRKRNHIINLEVLKYENEKNVKKIIFGVEDTFKHSPTKKEELELIKNSKYYNSKTFIYNGADEISQELFSHIIKNNSVDLNILTDETNTLKNIYDYEDRPLEKNLKTRLIMHNIKITKNSINTLIIINKNIENGKKLILNEIQNNKKIYILDALNVNKCNEKLINFLINEKLLNKIKFYSSWNTISNRLGTIISMIIACNNNHNEKEAQKFLLECLLEDYLYQTKTRNILKKIIQEKNENIYDVKKETLDYFYKNIFLRELEPLKIKLMKNMNLKSLKVEKFILPWNRIFECKIKIKVI